MNKSILIQASARSNGDTRIASNYIIKSYGVDFMDLKTKNIDAFDYELEDRKDDFLPSIEFIVGNYDNLIFISPVYWYTMSGILKNFMDRITDLLKWHKDTGRKLRGKNMGIISSCNDDDVDSRFAYPFESSCDYLGMNYLGHCHVWIESKKLTSESINRLDRYFNN